MCGRFAQRTPARVLARTFGVEVPETKARYNVAPTQEVLAVRQQAAGRAAVMLKWGLVPAWAKDTSMGARLINARAETVADKPAFREALKLRRCLIPASGFYEWRREGTHKQPYYFHLSDDRPFAFAGLWERWGEDLETCTILTTAANPLVAATHDRMPVILKAEDYDLWLDESVRSRELLTPLLVPYPAAEMTAQPVSLYVNSPAHDVEQCLAPAT